MSIANAKKAAVNVTTQEYYGHFCDVVGRAKHSILIAGWDFQPDLALVRRANGDELECVTQLGELITDIARERPELEIRIISWDFSKYFGDAETLIDQSQWVSNLPDNVKVEFDPAEVAGGAHHHKIVVVDDDVAFVGGTDLSVRRWDTDERPPVDPRRVDPTGDDYPPWHDVQMIVQGDAARQLGDFVREQWESATDETLSPAPSADLELWPEIEADFEQVTVEFARTWPMEDGDDELESEISDVYRRLIRDADELIYIENQYFTHDGFIDLLKARLAEEEGPEIVVVLPASYRDEGEKKSFAVARDKNIEHLRKYDPYDRFRAVAPWALHEPEGEDADVYVHAKLMIADDREFVVGSANFAERSFNVDTEVAAVISAQGGAPRERIAGVRNRLLALHTGRDVEEIDDVTRQGGLVEFVDGLTATDGATLRPIETDRSHHFMKIPMWFADPSRSLWSHWQAWALAAVSVVVLVSICVAVWAAVFSG